MSIKRIALAVTGSALVLTGLVLLVLPGPGILLLMAGLSLLGGVHPAARRLSRRLAAQADRALNKTIRRHQ